MMKTNSPVKNIVSCYIPKERWKSKLKRVMIYKHVMEDSTQNRSPAPRRMNSPLIKELSPLSKEKTSVMESCSRNKIQKLQPSSLNGRTISFGKMYNSVQNLDKIDQKYNKVNRVKLPNKSNERLKYEYSTVDPKNMFKNLSSTLDGQYYKSTNIQSHRVIQTATKFTPLTMAHKNSDSEMKMFTETRPMLTPQAKPKELRFKFDQDTLKEKEEEKSATNDKHKKQNKKKPKNRHKIKELNLAANEENVDDDTEEKSVFLLNPCLIKKPLYNKQTMNKGIQVKLDKSESKLNIKEIAAGLSELDNADAKLYSKRFEILQELYDKMIALVSDTVSPVRPDLPLYYQMVLDEATEGLKDIGESQIEFKMERGIEEKGFRRFGVKSSSTKRTLCEGPTEQPILRQRDKCITH